MAEVKSSPRTSRDLPEYTILDLEKPGAESSPLQEVPIQYPGGLKLFLIVLALMFAMFLVAIDMSIIATAVPRITNEFGSLDQVGWYGSAFFLCLAAFVSFWGKVYKHLDLKWSFLASIFVFELGSLICGVSPNSTAFIVGRAIQGTGGSGVVSGVYIVIAFVVKPAMIPTYIGIVGAMYSIASVIGPVLGGALTEKATWRWCFYINLPIGGAALTVLASLFQTPVHAKSSPLPLRDLLLTFDAPSVIVLVGSLICLSLALEWGGTTKPWNSTNVIGTLTGFSLLAIFWGIIQWKQGERAMVVGRIIRQRTIGVCAAFILCTNISGFARVYNLPIYFQAIDGVSPEESGIRVLPSILSISLFTFLGSSAVGKIGYFQPFLIIGSMLSTIGGGLIYTFDIGTLASKFIGYQIIAGAGTGLAIQVPIIVAQAMSSRADLSITMSTILFFQFVAGAAGVSISQSIFTNRLLENVSLYAPSVTKAQILATGAYGLRDEFDDSQLLGVLRCYMIGLKDAWFLSIAFSGIAFLISFLAERKSIKPKSVLVSPKSRVQTQEVV